MAKNQKNELEYDYNSRIFAENFYKKNSKTKLSPEMSEIYACIKEIAMERLTEKEFIKKYDKVDKCLFADLTEIRDSKKRRVGFLFASYHTRVTKNGEIIFIGKAFPSVRIENRGSGYDRSKLYEKFIYFYFECIANGKLKDFQTEEFLNLFPEDKIRKDQKLKQYFSKIASELITANEMKIEILVENPATYSDLCKWGFEIENIPSPDPILLTIISTWPTEELIRKSYLKSKDPKHNPPYLEKDITFAVNLTPKNWRDYFETTDKYKKYYLWENYSFPNNAYKVVIPINAKNIKKALYKIKSGNKK